MRTKLLLKAKKFFIETFISEKFPNRDELYEKTINSSFVPINSKIFFGIYYLKEILDEIQSNDLKPFNITTPQFEIIKILYFSKEKTLTQSSLKDIIFSSNSNISSLLLRLEEKKLIQRFENSSNRREKILGLTKKGEDLLFDVVENTKFDYLQSFLTNQEAKEFINLNKKLIDNIKKANLK